MIRTLRGTWFGLLVLGTLGAAEAFDAPQPAAAPPGGTEVVSLDGRWLLATDPENAGRDAQWWTAPRPDAQATRVPWIIQDAFPGYHGVAWYWRDFTAPVNPRPHGRTLLRFWAVDYKADVWLNGVAVGTHEGGESPFTLDVTAAVRPGEVNRLAVRVVNPTHSPIDGLVLNEIPHRNKALPYREGSAWDLGGIVDSVELLLAPAARVDDVFARPDWKTGVIRVQATVCNTLDREAPAHLVLSVAPAAGGATIAAAHRDCPLPPGETRLEADLQVPAWRLWDLSDPYLYRVTARLVAQTPGKATGEARAVALDETSVRCGFRDFRFADGAFRLNGRRIYLRCSHTGNCCPIGLEMPHDPDFLRRDLINAKAMRFNAIRFISGVAKRYQLDLCDEIGLMVYEEAYASWCLADSPQMARRYDESILGMVRRDRNHPSVTLWGLLNETPDGPVFRHALALLPELRKLDDSRIVMLNSGRWDSQSGGIQGIDVWRPADGTDPCVTRNSTDHVVQALGITWQPGQLAFHPGRDGQYAVVRWTAPAEGKVHLDVRFQSIAERATTDVHVFHGDAALFDGGIHVGDGGPESHYAGDVTVRAGDTIDCVVGYGNGNYGADSTALDLTVRPESGESYQASAGFHPQKNPNGPWSYGMLAPGELPRPSTFALFENGNREEAIGTLSNPGSTVWEDALGDTHPYQRVPHTADIIQTLRTHSGNGKPTFLSEYGIGSATDLLRVVRLFEQAGKPEVEDAQLYRSWRDQFTADYQRWRLDEAFARPEDFFAQSIARMAGQRLLGLNAIRANPLVIGHSITGTVDQGMTAEGLWTTFRELKPGTVDAVFEGFAPLRLCLFAEPVNVYRHGPVKLEAVLANEDVLPPGEYPLRLEVVGPGLVRPWSKTLTVTIPDRKAGEAEPPMVMPLLAEDVPIDGPSGKYRFLATFERGAAAAGGETEFYLYDPADMPAVEGEVVLWGDDPGLAQWLADRGIRVRAFDPAAPGRDVILVPAAPPAPGDRAVWAALARRIATGSTAIFLAPAVFARGDQPTAWLPLANKGSLVGLPTWLYHKDDWNKEHPIFDGLPAPGVMDYTVYRELIPGAAFSGQDPPAEAVCGGINATLAYSSGLMVAVYDLGAGRFILNTLPIRENLGPNPVAERLLRNLLRAAARDREKPPAALPADFDQQLQAMGYAP